MKRNTADPILRNYKIEAWNRDSTAVVVNVTDLFVADLEEMSPFSKYGLYTAFELKKTFQKERSMLGEIKGFQRQCGGAQYVELYFSRSPAAARRWSRTSR